MNGRTRKKKHDQTVAPQSNFHRLSCLSFVPLQSSGSCLRIFHPKWSTMSVYIAKLTSWRTSPAKKILEPVSLIFGSRFVARPPPAAWMQKVAMSLPTKIRVVRMAGLERERGESQRSTRASCSEERTTHMRRCLSMPR